MMNILARILSHGFAIAVVVILAVGYIYRGELFPGMELPAFLYPGSPATVEAEAPTGDTGHEEPVIESTDAAPVGEPAPEPAGESTTDQPPPVDQEQMLAGTVPEATAETQSLDQPLEDVTNGEAASADDAGELSGTAVTATDSLQRDTTPGMDEGVAAMHAAPEETATPPVGTGTVETTPEVPAPADDSSPDTDIQESASNEAGEAELSSPATAMTADGVTESAAITPPQPEGEIRKPYPLLAAAREAFWMHNYTEAEANYRALIALEPDNPDGYGELGNMYFTQGNWPQAAEAYFNAGKMLVQAGRIEQAKLLVKVIRGLNGSQADDLEALVNTANETNR